MGRLAPPPQLRVQRYRQKQGSIAYSSGTAASPLPIGQTDYTTVIDIMSNQTITTGVSAPVIAGYGAYGPLGNIQVKVNGGRAPWSLPGYHTNIVDQVLNRGYQDSLAASPIAVSTTQNWKNHVRAQLTVDPLTNKGAFYTGDTSLNMSVVITGNAAATVFSTVNGATIAGSWDVWTEKFNLPPPDEAGGWLDEITFYTQTELYGTYPLSAGWNNITLETDQDWLQLICILYTGNNTDATFAPADGLYTAAEIVVNDRFHIFDTVDEQSMRFDMLQTYRPRVLPAGSLVFDWMRLYNSRRDVMPTDANMAKKFTLKINSTSASNKVDVISRTAMDSQFAERWLRSAAAKQQARARAAA